MLRMMRAVWFAGFTFLGLLLLGASFWRALFGTLALLALRVTPVPPPILYGIGAVIFALGILEWSTGLLLR
ncbi:hypothetical protein [Falsiroseomonas selenitidurans]|uniref:Uncharacterized protein n=1 Tax=Falsiroseomonas selenitidurans TaxID=2716335 RepID=A0ABX1E680_9PROT|nr:hypothetical protein [Falsiroseomonas selenitidurans]NKC32687.1 hypothetical protein [Falsiroseomonas selenitidurans]